MRAAAARSALGGVAAGAAAAVAAAWRTSATRSVLARPSRAFAATSEAARVRWWGTAIAVACLAHAAARALMPATVAPAVPIAFYGGAGALAAIIAWQAEAFVRAWPAAGISRLLTRSPPRGAPPPGTR